MREFTFLKIGEGRQRSKMKWIYVNLLKKERKYPLSMNKLKIDSALYIKLSEGSTL